MTDNPLFASQAERTAETARLNDLARAAPRSVNAVWLATSGVAALIAEAPDAQITWCVLWPGFPSSTPTTILTESAISGRSSFGASRYFGRSTTIIPTAMSTLRSSGAPS